MSSDRQDWRRPRCRSRRFSDRKTYSDTVPARSIVRLDIELLVRASVITFDAYRRFVRHRKNVDFGAAEECRAAGADDYHV